MKSKVLLTAYFDDVESGRHADINNRLDGFRESVIGQAEKAGITLVRTTPKELVEFTKNAITSQTPTAFVQAIPFEDMYAISVTDLHGPSYVTVVDRRSWDHFDRKQDWRLAIETYEKDYGEEPPVFANMDMAHKYAEEKEMSIEDYVSVSLNSA